MEIRFASNPQDFKHFDTNRIRNEFLLENLMQDGQINCVYSHYDRMISGGVVPVLGGLKLGTYDSLKAEYFLERREMGILNTGGSGKIIADGNTYILENKEVLYLGKGTKEIEFFSDSAQNPSKYFFLSCPAHATYPAQKMTLAEAIPVDLGSQANANQRTVFKFIHLEGIKSCQLVMGMTMLKPGNMWNTMPSHYHDRRMEVYFYFDLPEDQRVFHMMGEYNETRHMVVANNQGIISPPWSVHTGVATHNYSFIWGMCGENLVYTDMDFVPMDKIR